MSAQSERPVGKLPAFIICALTALCLMIAGSRMVLSSAPAPTCPHATIAQPDSDICHPIKVLSPDHPLELALVLAKARKKGQQISLVGGGFSQGNQTCANTAVQINTREMNQLIHIDLEKSLVTVQAGMTWQRLQGQLEPFGLSVAAMQSYNDFTIGGSLGVNAHGQDIHHNPVSESVTSLKVLLTDGNHIRASRTENPEIFHGVIGTYGLIGIITEVTLNFVPNTMLEKQTELVKTAKYRTYFNENIKNNSFEGRPVNSISDKSTVVKSTVKSDPIIALHSARLSINPLWRFRNMVVVNYRDTHQPAPSPDLLPEPELADPGPLNIMKKSWLGRIVRTTIEYFFLEKGATMSRTQAMGESVESLKNTVPNTRDILQEYFVPPENLETFIDHLNRWVGQHSPDFKLINATVRWVPANRDALLPYAPKDRFAIVLFINLPTTKQAEHTMKQASQEMIASVLELNGRYYLPYGLYASKDQLYQSYPEFSALIELKKRLDPDNLLTNQFYKAYGPNIP